MAKRDPKEIRRLLAHRQRHGLSWSELEAESGVPRGTLCWWQWRLGEDRRKRGAKRRFVQLVAPAPTPVASVPTAIEVVLEGGCRVLVPPGFDLEHLRRVLQALES